MRKASFSLIELVVAVVILGVLAAIAIPRFSLADDSDRESALRTNLAILRTAIELYHRDHAAYPGQMPAGTAGAEAGTAAGFIRQLTHYTDAQGHVSRTPSGVFRYGPYLRRGIPLCPLSPMPASSEVYLIAGREAPAYLESATNAGWIYNYQTGYIAANSNDTDADGVRYDRY